MKNILIILFSVIIILLLGYNYRSYFGYADISFSLDTKSQVKASELRIYKGRFPAYDTNYTVGKEQLIFDGENFFPFETDYGENDFLIVYRDSCFSRFRHFKTTNRKDDDYVLVFVKSGNMPGINVYIDGTNPQTLHTRFKCHR